MVILFVVGVVLGMFLSTILAKYKIIGILRVDKSDPSEPPYLFLELLNDINKLEKKKYVVLKVCAKNFISQK